MRVLAVLFFAVYVHAVPNPGYLETAYDDVNGTVTAMRSLTDDDGNTEVLSAASFNDTSDDVPLEAIGATDDNHGNEETKVTSSFKESSSNFTTTVDKDGNEVTSGSSDEMSGEFDGTQFNEDGNIFGDQAMGVDGTHTDFSEVNGVGNVESSRMKLRDQMSKDADGELLHKRHFGQIQPLKPFNFTSLFKH